MKINYPTYRDLTFIKPGSCFSGAFFSHMNFSSRFTRSLMFIKSMCDIFKDCRKAFVEKRNKNRSQFNKLVEHYLVNTVHLKIKMLHAAIKRIWGQKWK